MKQWLYKLASPKHFYAISRRLEPWCWLVFLVSLSVGVFWGLFIAPSDYQQGDAYRIMFVHVPSAICSLGLYSFIAVNSALFLIWRTKTSDILAKIAVPIGMAFTALALVTGSLWGKPMWGTFWIWDPRLTSDLILLFVYFGLFALRRAIPNQNQAQKAVAIFALVGAVDLPVIHYSVYWWNSLHQKSTLLGFHAPTMASSMLLPLLIMIVAFISFTVAMIFRFAQNEILLRETSSEWVSQEVLR